MVNYSVEAIQDSIFYATNNTIGEDRQFLIISSDNYEAKGYEGNTRLAIFFNYKGVVSTVEIIHSQDTRSFVRRLKRSNFLKQFQNWNGETKIKALTGVTFTSDAVARTVNNMQKLIIKITTHINKG
jgi:Na+-translocating ferredoxin:NAD+ oxidoreductase RnfG subunit